MAHRAVGAEDDCSRDERSVNVVDQALVHANLPKVDGFVPHTPGLSTFG